MSEQVNVMGCYASKPNPPTYVVIERENIDDEPTVEVCGYTITGARKVLKQITDQLNTSDEEGKFVALYKLVEGSYVSKSVLRAPLP